MNEQKKPRSRSSSSHSSRKRRSPKIPELSCFPTISEILGNHLFSGWVTERKWVESLKDYRDVIEVDEHEAHLNSHLNVLVNEIDGVKSGKTWINITGPTEDNPCYFLWVLLNEPPTPGHYWFYIKEVTSNERFGLCIDIKIVRPLSERDYESASKRKSRFNKSTENSEWSELLQNLRDVDIQEINTHIFSYISPSNIVNLFKLTVALFATLSMSFIHLIRYGIPSLMNLIDVFGIFIMRATPAFQSILHFFEKIIGGILILLSIIFKDLRKPAPPTNTQPNRYQQSIDYPRPQARYINREDY